MKIIFKKEQKAIKELRVRARELEWQRNRMIGTTRKMKAIAWEQRCLIQEIERIALRNPGEKDNDEILGMLRIFRMKMAEITSCK